MFRIMRLSTLAVLLAATWGAGAQDIGGFAVVVTDADGQESELDGFLSADFDDLVVDYQSQRPPYRDLPIDWQRAQKEGYRVFGPGDAHYGSITIRARVGKNSKELYQWWQATSKGKNIRKNISVIALKRDGTEARRWNALECFPTRWDPGEYSPSGVRPPGPKADFTLTLSYNGLELPPPAAEPGKPRGKGVEVSIEGSAPEDWRLWADGGPVCVSPPGLETSDCCLNPCCEGSVVDSSGGSDQFHTTTPGHKYIDTLTLRGPLTSGRKALCQWITETVHGKPWKRTVTVKEITKDGGAGKTFIYHDCFPTRYVFPAFNANGTGNLYEEVHIKPIRMDIA